MIDRRPRHCSFELSECYIQTCWQLSIGYSKSNSLVGGQALSSDRRAQMVRTRGYKGHLRRSGEVEILRACEADTKRAVHGLGCRAVTGDINALSVREVPIEWRWAGLELEVSVKEGSSISGNRLLVPPSAASMRTPPGPDGLAALETLHTIPPGCCRRNHIHRPSPTRFVQHPRAPLASGIAARILPLADLPEGRIARLLQGDPLVLRSENAFTVAPPFRAAHAGLKPGATRACRSAHK